MNLADSIQNFGNKTTLISSVITKIIRETFMTKKNIDISDYIISVSLSGNLILVKTGNPMINNELLLLSDIIQKSCGESLKQLGIDIEDIQIRYI